MPTVWFASSEPSCFKGTFSVNTNNAYFDPQRTRCSIMVDSTNKGVLEIDEVKGKNSELGWWLNFRVSFVGSQPMWGPTFFDIYDETNTKIITVSFINVSGWMTFSLIVDGMTASSGYYPYPNYNLRPFNLHCYTLDNNCYLDIYADKNPIVNLNIPNKPNPGFKRMEFSSCRSVGGNYGHWSEFILSDFNNIGLRAYTYYISSNGYYTNGYGDYTDISSITLDGKAISLPDTGNRKSFKLTKQGNALSDNIVCVCVNAKISTNNENDLKYGLRIDDNDYYGNNLECQGNSENKSWTWFKNPKNNIPWGTIMPSNLELVFNSVEKT